MSDAEVVAALHRLGSLLAAKDTAIIGEFAADADGDGKWLWKHFHGPEPARQLS